MVNNHAALDRVFGALADPVRRAMLTRLVRGEATVTALGESHGLTLPGVLKHVRYLESAGLVAARKEGRARVCRLAPHALATAAGWLEQYRIFWEGQLDSLDRFLTLQGTTGVGTWPPPRKPSRSKSAATTTPRRSRSSPRGRKPSR